MGYLHGEGGKRWDWAGFYPSSIPKFPPPPAHPILPGGVTLSTAWPHPDGAVAGDAEPMHREPFVGVQKVLREAKMG